MNRESLDGLTDVGALDPDLGADLDLGPEDNPGAGLDSEADPEVVLDSEADLDPEDDAEGADVFTRDYVAGLRAEAAQHRKRAKESCEVAEQYARALFLARVEADGRLADPADLEYSADLLQDPGAVAEAVEALLEQKPHLRRRRVAGNIGQGEGAEDTPTLLGLLRLGA